MPQSVIHPSVKIAPSATERKIISTAELQWLLGVSSATLDTLRKRPDFPKPFRFSGKGKLSWSESEIWAWVELQRTSGGPDNVA